MSKAGAIGVVLVAMALPACGPEVDAEPIAVAADEAASATSQAEELVLAAPDLTATIMAYGNADGPTRVGWIEHLSNGDHVLVLQSSGPDAAVVRTTAAVRLGGSVYCAVSGPDWSCSKYGRIGEQPWHEIDAPGSPPEIGELIAAVLPFGPFADGVTPGTVLPQTDTVVTRQRVADGNTVWTETGTTWDTQIVWTWVIDSNGLLRRVTMSADPEGSNSVYPARLEIRYDPRDGPVQLAVPPLGDALDLSFFDLPENIFLTIP